MTDLRHVLMGVLMGLVLIGFGLVPGLFQTMATSVRDFSERFTLQLVLPSRKRAEFRQPRLLAAFGAALIALSLLAYLAK